MLPVGLENALMRIDLISWIDLLIGFARHHGRLHRFEWRGNPNGADVENTLRRYHIHGYGRSTMIEVETDTQGKKKRVYRRWFYVNAEQAEWAEYLLSCICVPLEGYLNPNNVNAWGKPLPRSWDQQKGRRGLPRATFVELISDWMAGIWR